MPNSQRVLNMYELHRLPNWESEAGSTCKSHTKIQSLHLSFHSCKISNFQFNSIVIAMITLPNQFNRWEYAESSLEGSQKMRIIGITSSIMASCVSEISPLVAPLCTRFRSRIQNSLIYDRKLFSTPIFTQIQL